MAEWSRRGKPVKDFSLQLPPANATDLADSKVLDRASGLRLKKFGRSE